MSIQVTGKCWHCIFAEAHTRNFYQNIFVRPTLALCRAFLNLWFACGPPLTKTTELTKTTKTTQAATNKEPRAGFAKTTETTKMTKITGIRGANHGFRNTRLWRAFPGAFASESFRTQPRIEQAQMGTTVQITDRPRQGLPVSILQGMVSELVSLMSRKSA